MHIKAGDVTNGIINYISSTILLFLIFSLRYLKTSIWNFRIATFIITLLFSYWMFVGAINGYASIWSIAFPPFVFFLLGKKEGYFWTLLLFTAALLAFYNPLGIADIYDFNLTFATRIIAAYILVFLITTNYETVRLNYLEEISRKQERLLIEKDQLQKEMAIRKAAERELRQHHSRLEELISDRTAELRRKNQDLEETLHNMKLLHDDVLHSERKLVESEKKYRLLADNVSDLIWSMDMNLQFTFISPAIESLYGYTIDEAMVLPIDKWNTEESFQKIMNSWVEHLKLEESPDSDPDRNIILELEQLKKDGTTFWTELKVSFLRDTSGNAKGIVGVTRDITERRKTQDFLIQTEKMMTVGGLAAGMAHELNNPLSIIMNSAQNLERRTSPGLESNQEVAKKVGTDIEAVSAYMKKRKISEYVQYIYNATRRASNIIHDMLMFSRKGSLKYEETDINIIIEKALNLYSQDYDLSRKYDFKKIKIERNFSENLPATKCVITQIEQVLLNIFKNAAIALSDKESPTMDPAISISTASNSGHVSVKISDNGPGMDQEVLEHVFDPFYTTREAGKGTGLGLSISYYIITTNHKGAIEASSWPGKGTAITIRLPV